MCDVPRPSLPAETEVQAGIVVESPKRGGFHAWTDLERLPAETEVQAGIAQPRFGGPPNIFSSPKVYKLF